MCDVLGCKKASEAVRLYVSSSDTVKRGVTRTVKNRYGVCEGKMKKVQIIFVNESGFYALVLGSKLGTAHLLSTWGYRKYVKRGSENYHSNSYHSFTKLKYRCDGQVLDA